MPCLSDRRRPYLLLTRPGGDAWSPLLEAVDAVVADDPDHASLRLQEVEVGEGFADREAELVRVELPAARARDRPRFVACR